MIIERKVGFIRIARVILQTQEFLALLQSRKYHFISAILYDRPKEPEKYFRKEKKTTVIDLTPDSEVIFSKFNDTARNEIRRSKKIPELKFKLGDRNLDAIYEFHKEFEKLQGRRPKGKNSFQGCIFFTAYYKKDLIAVVACYDAKPYLRARAIFSRRLGAREKETSQIISFANRRIVYEICKYGHENGYAGFDLGAVNLTDSMKAGITKFKMSFGGEIRNEYTYLYRSKIFYFLSKIEGIAR